MKLNASKCNRGGYFCLLLLMLTALLPDLKAQTANSPTVEERWKGTKLEEIAKGTYDGKTVTITQESKRFYLYNVGTGKFITCDGEGGKEAVLTYRDFGAAFTLGYNTAWKQRDANNNLKFNVIYSGLEGKDRKGHNYVLGIEYPGVSTDKKYTWDNDWKGDSIWGPVFNAQMEKDLSGSDWSRRHFTFKRVETDEDADTYTYYLLETVTYVDKGSGNNINKYCFLGAAAGQKFHQSTPTTDFVGYNSVTFDEVTESVSAAGGGSEAIEKPTMLVKYTDYYKWRLVTEDDMLAVAKNENKYNYGGLVDNLSYLVPDPFFDGDRNEEFNTWTVYPAGTGDTETKQIPNTNSDDKKDYPWTYLNTYQFRWGATNATESTRSNLIFNTKNKNGQYGDLARAINAEDQQIQPWDNAILRKLQFVSKDNGKYDYALLEGKGRAEQTVKAPLKGYYRIACRGLATAKDVQLYAKGSQGVTERAYFVVDDAYANVQKVARYNKISENMTSPYRINTIHERGDTLAYTYASQVGGYTWDQWGTKKGGWHGDGASNFYAKRFALWTGTDEGLISVGEALHDNEKYNVSVVVYVDEGDTLTYGVEKTDATRQDEAITVEWIHSNHWIAYNGWTKEDDISVSVMRRDNYYFDKEIAAFDNIQIYYLGENKPFVLNEEETSDEYIKDEYNERISTENQAYKNYGVTTYLKRSFTVGEWNSIVLPVNMTYEQTREYFGEDVKLAKLSGINTNTTDYQTYNPCIDFTTVAFTEPFEKVEGLDLSFVEKLKTGNAIEAGKMYIIRPTKNPGDRYSFTEVDQDGKTTTTEIDACYMVGRHDYAGTMPAHSATYTGEDTQESANKLFVYFYGTYCYLDAEHGPQPGCYAFSGGDLWHLDGKKEIYGFRGWLSATNALGDPVDLTFGVDTTGATTFIDGIRMEPTQATDGRVYNLKGQLVSHNGSLEGLPAGIYITAGRKVVVR